LLSIPSSVFLLTFHEKKKTVIKAAPSSSQLRELSLRVAWNLGSWVANAGAEVDEHNSDATPVGDTVVPGLKILCQVWQ